ncbi:hypothetical protein VTJ04DRAFT_6618 [Mycothermus thermophilus]|uniref:uncharacterized protein n=1 Tax=Humicola insolens TaxID=85995 RepID=UPI003742EC48
MKHQVKEKISQTSVRNKPVVTYEACILYIVLFVQTPTQTRSLIECIYTKPFFQKRKQQKGMYNKQNHESKSSFHVRSMTDNAGESEKTRADWQVLS